MIIHVVFLFLIFLNPFCFPLVMKGLMERDLNHHIFMKSRAENNLIPIFGRHK